MTTEPYLSRRSPRTWQTEVAPVMRGRVAFAILAGMRCGKSKTIVDDWGAAVAAGELMDLLIVAPGGVYLTWPAAINDDLPASIMSRTKVLCWESRRARTKSFGVDVYDLVNHDGPRVLVVNVEALSSVDAARALVLKFLRQRPGASEIAIDESVKIKSPDSSCGKFCAEQLAPLAARRRILSGLIAPRSPLDLWNQFRFLDPSILGKKTFVEFRARYAKFKKICVLPQRVIDSMLKKRVGVGGYLTAPELRYRAACLDPTLNINSMSIAALKQFVEASCDSMTRDQKIDAIGRLGGYVQTIPVIENLDPSDPRIVELRDMIAPHSFRVRLEDCYDMPPSDYSFRDVELHAEQRRVYDGIKRDATVKLESLDHVTTTHVIVQLLRLHQVLCGHVVDENGLEHEVPELRTRALLDLIEDYDGKAVVWCSYDRSVRRVSEALEKEYGDGSVARFWGGNVKTREQEEIRFKSDPACRFQVATPDAGGYGRAWHAADLSVYYSCKNNLDHRQQSEDRVKADGKNRPVAYVDLRARGTVEEKIIACLRDKIDMSQVINGDDWRKWLV